MKYLHKKPPTPAYYHSHSLGQMDHLLLCKAIKKAINNSHAMAPVFLMHGILNSHANAPIFLKQRILDFFVQGKHNA